MFAPVVATLGDPHTVSGAASQPQDEQHPALTGTGAPNVFRSFQPYLTDCGVHSYWQPYEIDILQTRQCYGNY